MPPLRPRDLRVSTSNPTSARRQVKNLHVDTRLANENGKRVTSILAAREFESSLVEKEKELSSLLSPLDGFQASGSRLVGAFELPLSLAAAIPEVVNSFESFHAMRAVILPYLIDNNLGHLVPESKLYRSLYFPYR